MIEVFALLLALTLPLPLQASIDLYLSRKEMKRLLRGHQGEVDYITDGGVSNYASQSFLQVAENISEVAFSWRSSVLQPKYAYKMEVTSEDGVLPVLRIPHQGFVPNRNEQFVMEYRCSKPGTFQVNLNISIAYPSELNRLNVVLKQKKLCPAIEKLSFGNAVEGRERSSLGVRITNNSLPLTGENVFYMVIGCLFAVVLVIVVLLYIYFRSDQKPHSRYRLSNDNLSSMMQQRRSANLASLCAMDHSDASYLINASEIRRERFSVATNRMSAIPQLINEKKFVLDIASTLNELHVDKKFFEVLPVHEIEGTFGELKWAIWRKKFGGANSILSADEEDDCIDEVLLVKALKSTADTRQLNIFLEQALRFHHIPRCEHLAQVESAAFCGLYDTREKTVDFPLICYKHQGYGNLKRFLQRCRSGIVEEMQKTSFSNMAQTLRTHELVSMAIQILKAVLHLHKYSIIHKDIATRNCLITEISQSSDRFFVQLCDTALSKDLFPNDYHCLGDNTNKPVKWMAYESLTSNLYNSATDAWSFGVTLWELLSCGQQPYLDVDPDEIVFLLQQGHRLSQPYNCPDDLYGVMQCCWQLDYRDRPTCDQLLSTLQNFMLQLQKFI